GGVSRISRMRCTTAVCEAMETGGVLRARERACKAITSPGSASRKRLSHFLTQARDLPSAIASACCVQLGCCCASQRKLARCTINWASLSMSEPPFCRWVFPQCSAGRGRLKRSSPSDREQKAEDEGRNDTGKRGRSS